MTPTLEFGTTSTKDYYVKVSVIPKEERTGFPTFFVLAWLWQVIAWL